MKVIVIDNNFQGDVKPVSWYVVADSALSNSGKPFYIPEEGGEVEVHLSMAVRFSRLGKYIEPRFAKRYFKEIAPALHFRLEEMKRELITLGLPVSAAVSFDRSVMADKYRNIEDDYDSLKVELLKNGESVGSLKPADMANPLEELIHRYSKTNTIKMGDVMLPAVGPGLKIKEGDRLDVIFCGEPSFTVKIK